MDGDGTGAEYEEPFTVCHLAFTGQPGTKWFTKLSSTDQQTCREAALTRIEDQYGVIIDDGDVSITSLDAASSDPETAVTGQREVAQALEGALGEDSDALGRAAQFVHETRASMLAARSELGDTNVSDLGGYNIAAMSRDVSLTAKRLQRADKEEEAEATRLAMSAVTRARYGLPARTSMEKFIMEHRVRH